MSNHDMEEIKAIAVMEKKEVEWSNSKEPNIVQKDSKAVEVTEKKEVPAAKRVVPAEPNLEQTENTTSATKEIEGPTVAVERTRELPDIPMPKEVQKEWTCDICELTVESDKVLNSHLQGKKHKATYEALKAKNQPNIIPASTAEETEQPVEEPQNNVTAKVLIQKTITNHEEKQQGQPTSISTSSAKKSDQPMREEAEKGVSNSELEQKKQAVEVTEKNEVPAAKRVVPAEPNLEQTVNTTSAMPKEGLTLAVATTRELPDIPMPKEVQKEWTCDICQLTVACEKILNSHLQGKKHKTALKAKDQPTVEEPQKSVSSKDLKQRIVTKYEEKQQGQQTIASASTAMKSNQPTKEESEKRVSNSEPEQKEEAVGVKDSTLRCNICNISCSGENNLVSHFNGRKHLARIRLMIKSVGSGQV
uniref:C2H2-type domain-containing protein n=1 Tax=Fagus sylvatica TaxID=28930 RepID=A0A2N9IEX3_FAGSY